MGPKINWDKAVQTEINKRGARAAHFLERIFEITEYFITDESRLSHFQDPDDIQDIRRKIFNTYGYPVQKHHFSIPFWKFLDEHERFRLAGKANQGVSETEVLQRELALRYFFEQVFEVGFFRLTDAFALGHFVNVDDLVSTESVGEQTYRVYGTRLKREHCEMPLWQLVDELEANCLQSELMT